MIRFLSPIRGLSWSANRQTTTWLLSTILQHTWFGLFCRRHGHVNLPGNLLSADQATVHVSGRTPVEDSRRIILILNLVRVPAKPKVKIQLRLQWRRQFGVEWTDVNALIDQALIRKIPRMKRTVNIPGRDNWCRWVPPTRRQAALIFIATSWVWGFISSRWKLFKYDTFYCGQ